jgi:Tat protein secretion system quality control protein TatD with DNase activity
VAYGEIGLDYHYEHSPRTDQKRKFRDMCAKPASSSFPSSFTTATPTRICLRS